MTYEEIILFHGHDCPGLAMGYRMAVAAMESLESVRAADEERVAIPEPEPARIMESIPCAFCGEGVMASRIRQRDAKLACIPCCEAGRTGEPQTPNGVDQPCP